MLSRIFLYKNKEARLTSENRIVLFTVVGDKLLLMVSSLPMVYWPYKRETELLMNLSWLIDGTTVGLNPLINSCSDDGSSHHHHHHEPAVQHFIHSPLQPTINSHSNILGWLFSSLKLNPCQIYRKSNPLFCHLQTLTKNTLL